MRTLPGTRLAAAQLLGHKAKPIEELQLRQRGAHDQYSRSRKTTVAPAFTRSSSVPFFRVTITTRVRTSSRFTRTGTYPYRRSNWLISSSP